MVSHDHGRRCWTGCRLGMWWSRSLARCGHVWVHRPILPCLFHHKLASTAAARELSIVDWTVITSQSECPGKNTQQSPMHCYSAFQMAESWLSRMRTTSIQVGQRERRDILTKPPLLMGCIGRNRQRRRMRASSTLNLNLSGARGAFCDASRSRVRGSRFPQKAMAKYLWARRWLRRLAARRLHSLCAQTFTTLQTRRLFYSM